MNFKLLHFPALPLLFLGLFGCCQKVHAGTGFSFQEGCNGVVTFSVVTQAGATYYWNFGDTINGGLNDIDSGANVTHQYAHSGTYLVTLQTAGGGNTATYYQQVFVGPFVQQQISGPTDVCAGATYTYTLANDTAGFQYTWLVSNGQIIGSSSGSQVEVLFSNVGAAVVSAIISNGAGCDSILTQNVQVHVVPQLVLPSVIRHDSGGGNDSTQVTSTGYCANSEDWVYVLSSTPGTITWSSNTALTESAEGVDSMLFKFPTPGITTIQVVEVTSFGCADTVSMADTVVASPSVTISAQNACLGSENYFTAVPNPAGTPLTYQWSFDDGTIATGINVTHTFANGGVHTAQLVATNQYGCTDTVGTNVNVDANAGPPITCAGPVCGGSTVTYATPPVSGASYHWTVTGGTIIAGGSLSDNTVEVAWGNNGVGEVELYLTGAGIYCQFPTVEYVPLLGGTQPISGPANPCQYSTGTYSTTLVPGGIYTWTVTGGGSIQSGQGTNQIQVYFYNTAATISVVIGHQILTCSSNASITVNPLGSFTVYGDQTACAGIATSFTAWPSAAFNWTVQGGTILSGNGTYTVSVLWDSAGTYSVTANVATGFCNTQSQVTVSVVNRQKETIQGNNQACVGSAQAYFSSPNESSYTWTIKGGTATGGTNSNTVLVTWNTAGSDTLMLIYYDANYCPDTAYYVVAVTNQNIPAFTGDTVACYNSTVVYTYPSTPGLTYVWETDGGLITGGQNTNSVSVNWVGNQLGTIRLKNTACNTYQQKNIVIRPTPLINFQDKNLTCDGSSVDLNVIQDYTAYNWSNALTTQSIHITTAGVYTVTVSDAFGCTASASQNLTPLPNNNFNTAYISVTIPPFPIPFSYLYLNAVGVPAPVSYAWNTGNVEATQYVSLAGSYTVTMTDQFGCTTSVSTTVIESNDSLYGGGGGSGTPSVILPCPGISPLYTTNNPVCNPVQFTPNVTATYYLWDFQDGVFSSLSNPTHRFNTAGTKMIFLYYSNDGVNWYKCEQDLVINSVMNISFTSTYGCQGAVTLTNTAVSALPVASVLWDLGDGNTSSTTPVLNYQYPNTASSYLVALILNDGVCTDSLQQPVSVNELNANFTYTGLCTNNPALFNDATIHSAVISKYAWNFGNSLTADYYDPVTYYNTANTYTASLTVTDGDGCTSISTQSITVNQFTQLTITPSGPTTFCQGSSVNLSIPTGYSSYWNNADTTSIITVSLGGNYFAWVQDIATGCSGFTDTVQVTENIPPSAFILNPSGITQLCAGNYISLDGAPYSGVTYQWYFNGTAVAQTDNLFLWGITPANSGTYQLVITDGNGCNDTSSALAITVNPNPPTPFITQNPTGASCSGAVITLSVSGPGLYQWSNSQEGNSITVTQSGSYSVTVYNSFGCSSVGYNYTSFAATPDLSLFPTGCYQICQNSDITVNGPAGMQSYLWSNGASTQGITLSASGTYSLSVTGTDGCSASSSSFNVDVFSASNIDLGNDTTICSGQSVVLNAGAYPTITWQDGSSNQIYTVTDSGEYSVTVVNASGCSSSDSIHVAVRSDSIDLGDDTTICGGATVVLAVTGSYTSYLWQNGSTASSFTVTQTGTYDVSVTDAFGCSAKDTVQVTVRADTVDLGDDTTVCRGDSVQLIVSGSYISYLWQDGSTNAAFVVTQTGTYDVTATDQYGCKAEDTVQVSVRSDTINLGDDTTICGGGSLPLLVTGSYASYVWQNGSMGSSYIVTQTGTYAVTATDLTGCTVSDSISVTVHSDTINLGNDTSICSGNSVLLAVMGNYTSYLWQNGSTTATLTVVQTGIYSVIATDAYGCTVSDSIQVSVRTESISLGNDTLLCNSNTLVLQVADTFASYLWQNGSTNQSYTVTQAGIYYVRATDSAGCFAADTIVVNKDSDFVSLGDDTTVCPNDTFQLLAIGNFASIVWQDGSTGPSYIVVTAGFYSVQVVDAAGCKAGDSITVSNYPVPQVSLPTNLRLCDSTVTISAANSFNAYIWSTGSTASSITVADSGVYYITVTDANGCTVSDSAVVHGCDSICNYYFIPNAFSPNGDGHNDMFQIYRSANAPPVQYFSMAIFDRWGEVMFETNNDNSGWDGRYKGQPVPPGVFTYEIKYVALNQTNVVQGTVTLVR